MRLVVTGGGTGGHIYPALEVGRMATEEGADLHYFGSIRGQELKITRALGIPFQGFPSEPLQSLKSFRGLKSLLRLQKARRLARVELKKLAPDVVFSTGGYSAGPVVAAARDLKIPYTIHTADSVPPKSSSMFAKGAAAFSCTFRSTVEFMTDIQVIRTGQPIRKLFRTSAKAKFESHPLVLVLGGSQGSLFLNETVPPAAAAPGFETRVLHVAGPKHLDSTAKLVEKLGISHRYYVVPFLDAEQMLEAYLQATVVVSRSGGTLAELALFGLPSVLVPLPGSANNHQFHNAMEFVNMNSATMLAQSETTPTILGDSVNGWLSNDERRANAMKNLQKWDVPDATERIWALIQQAAQ